MISTTQRQTLQQTFAPWLVRHLAILQAPAMELRQIISQEMATNPALEEVSPSSEEYERPIASSAADPDTPAYDPAEKPLSLPDYLLAQLDQGIERPIEIKIIGNLDDSGYFRGDLSAIAREIRCPLARVEAALRRIQSLEPAGVCAHDLAECLLLQLKRRNQENSLATKIVRHHLDLVAKKKVSELARLLDTDEASIQQAIEEIRSLDPRPGAAFSLAMSPVISPDIIIEHDEDTEKRKTKKNYHARLVEGHIPRIRIADTYKDMLGETGQPREVLAFLRTKIRTARAFLRAIEQRGLTLLAISEEIIRLQPTFIEQGLSRLVPMTLSHIAKKLDLHEATVSRAISGKYLQAPSGIFSMKDLFRKGLPTRTGETMSDLAICEAITQIVANEHTPSSDQAIVQTLEERGITIARRTVAKYRSRLGILPKHLREKK